MRVRQSDVMGAKASSIQARARSRLRFPEPEPMMGKAMDVKRCSSASAMAETTER